MSQDLAAWSSIIRETSLECLGKVRILARARFKHAPTRNATESKARLRMSKMRERFEGLLSGPDSPAKVKLLYMERAASGGRDGCSAPTISERCISKRKRSKTRCRSLILRGKPLRIEKWRRVFELFLRSRLRGPGQDGKLPPPLAPARGNGSWNRGSGGGACADAGARS